MTRREFINCAILAGGGATMLVLAIRHDYRRRQRIKHETTTSNTPDGSILRTVHPKMQQHEGTGLRLQRIQRGGEIAHVRNNNVAGYTSNSNDDQHSRRADSNGSSNRPDDMLRPVVIADTPTIANGTGGGASVRHSGPRKTVTMRVTAYCPCAKCCGTSSPGITASGETADTPLVAAPRHLPFYTWLIVPGYNNNRPVQVLDRGGTIKGNCLDVLFPTHQEALNWGVKYLQVEILP